MCMRGRNCSFSPGLGEVPRPSRNYNTQLGQEVRPLPSPGGGGHDEPREPAGEAPPDRSTADRDRGCHPTQSRGEHRVPPFPPGINVQKTKQGSTPARNAKMFTRLDQVSLQLCRGAATRGHRKSLGHESQGQPHCPRKRRRLCVSGNDLASLPATAPWHGVMSRRLGRILRR